MIETYGKRSLTSKLGTMARRLLRARKGYVLIGFSYGWNKELRGFMQ